MVTSFTKLTWGLLDERGKVKYIAQIYRKLSINVTYYSKLNYSWAITNNIFKIIKNLNFYEFKFKLFKFN